MQLETAAEYKVGQTGGLGVQVIQLAGGERPMGFRRATSGLEHLEALVEGSLEDLVAALEKNPLLCDQVLNQSGDKRYTPSTFIQQAGEIFHVGWFDNQYRSVRTFSRREWAVADYLLFSFGKGRLLT
jgi:hypothetical protein